MRIRTDIHAGRAPSERDMLKCLEEKKSLGQKIDNLENRLNASAAAATSSQTPYNVYPAPVGSYSDWSGYCG